MSSGIPSSIPIGPADKRPPASEFSDGQEWLLVRDDNTRVLTESRGDQWVSVDFETKSIQAESLNNVRHANGFSGADGGEQIQAAIDDANSQPGSNVVKIGPDGPDNHADAPRGNIWSVSSPITVPSDTLLDFEGAFVWLADTADIRHTFVNSTYDDGTGDRNENIHIRADQSTWFNGNVTNNLRADYTARENQWVEFHKVDHFSIRGGKWGPFMSFAITPIDVSSGWIGDFELWQLGPADATTTSDSNVRDGVHVFSAQDLWIGGIHGWAGDDAISIDARTNSRVSNYDGGDVRNIWLENIACWENPPGRGGESSMDLIQITPGESGTSQTVDGVFISNVAGYSQGRGVLDIGNGQHNPGLPIDQFKNIHADGVYGGDRTCIFNADTRNVSIRNVVSEYGTFTRDGISLEISPSYLVATAGQTVESLRVENFWIEPDQNIDANGTVALDGNVTDATIEKGYISRTANTDLHGVALRSDSTITDARFRDISFDNVPVAVSIATTTTTDDVRFDGLDIRGSSIDWSDENKNSSLGTTAGVLRNGLGEEAAGSGNAPTASNWSIGDEVLNSDDGTVHKLLPDGTWAQVA